MSNLVRWRTVQVPKVLLDKVEKQLTKKSTTHTSISDFVSDAVRKELEKELVN